MVQRLFLDRIDTEPAAATISRKNHLVTHTLTHETEPALTIVQFAKTRTEPALDAPVGQQRPPATGMIGWRQEHA